MSYSLISSQLDNLQLDQKGVLVLKLRMVRELVKCCAKILAMGHELVFAHLHHLQFH